MYGDNIASCPKSIVFENQEENIQNSSTKQSLGIYNFKSGGKIEFPLEFSVRDKFNQIIKSMDSGEALI